MTEGGFVRFLYLGQIRREKGIEHLIEAARELSLAGKRFSVSIAGPLEGWSQDTFAPDIARIVRADAQISSVVTFLGSVEDVDAVFQQHDVHVAPSLFEEPFGLVVVEAKQNARPSIIYPSGGMIELVEHRSDGWVCDRKSSDSLASAMSHYLNDPSAARSMGEQARASLSRLGLVRNLFNERWADVVRHAGQT